MKGEIKINQNKKIVEITDNSSLRKILGYGVSDFIGEVKASGYSVLIAENKTCVFESNCKIDVKISNFSSENQYRISYGVPDNILDIEVVQDNIQLSYELLEGENELTVSIYKNNKLEAQYSKNIFYIDTYEKQFLDELSKNSVTTHYRTGKYEDYNQSIPLLKSLGVNYIRTDFFWSYIFLNGKYNYDNYDKWINQIRKLDPEIKILGILNANSSMVGGDRKVNTEEELNQFIEFCVNTAKHYPDILDFEILNEPNGIYVTDDDIEWYTRMIIEVSSALKNVNPNIKITQYALSSGLNDKADYLSSKTFFEKTYNDKIYKLSDAFSYNVYYDTDKKLENHTRQFNNFGGFIKQYITEYGSSMFNKDDVQQAIDIVKQTCLLEQYNIEYKNIYNFWNTGNDSTIQTNNYGLLNNNYTPKKSYYAVKNYYENTNGSEYIGRIQDIDSNLEFYVYDKDGSPIAICWTKNKDENINLRYEEFIAYDLYGNEIVNKNGVLEVTNSPVYIKNIDRNYFYKAISDRASREYTEFFNNYNEQLNISNSMGEVKNKINDLKIYVEKLAIGEEISENEAISKMREHFNIGNLILDAYQRGELQIDEVKVSAMLDALNTIGYSFEDLVTITANNTYNANLELTKLRIENFDGKLNANPDINVIYPEKIAEFAKYYYEESNYISSLSELNPIKNGLIVSKGLHAYYLIGWANAFADIYIQYSNISVVYSTESFTNQDVTVTLNGSSEVEMISDSSHTFTENGSFNFAYRLYGIEKSVEVSVDWIDRIYPEFVGINDRIDETEAVNINVYDENLDSIVVTKDGQVIQFNNGDTLIEVGSYTVTARDKAGNTTIAEFRIVDYIDSNKEYYISPNGNGDGLSKNSPMNINDASKIRYYAGDKILFKAGERYNLDLNWSMVGAKEKTVTISSYGDGDMPVINGSIELVSNLNISGLKFTNNRESCLVTNQLYCENIAIFECVFENIEDTAIYLNKQVSNININNCIFRNCGVSGIALKNDDKSFVAKDVFIQDNMFIGMNNGICVSGKFLDETFENVQICNNYFINQSGDEAIISYGSVVDTKFDVKVFNNFYYNFESGYYADKNSLENLRNNLVSDNNTWYALDYSKFLNKCSTFEILQNDYNIERNSKLIIMNPESYQVEAVCSIAEESDDKDHIIMYMLEAIRLSSSNKQVQDVDTKTGAVTVSSGYEEFISSKIGSIAELSGKNSQERVEDVTVAEEAIPLAGWKKIAFVIVAIALVGFAISAYKNAVYWSDTKEQLKK